MNNKDKIMVELYNQSAENRTYGVPVSTLADATGVLIPSVHSALTQLTDAGLVETDILLDALTGKPKKSAWLTKDGWAKAKQLAGAEDVAKIASERAESSNNQANNASENSELADATIIDDATSQATDTQAPLVTVNLKASKQLDMMQEPDTLAKLEIARKENVQACELLERLGAEGKSLDELIHWVVNSHITLKKQLKTLQEASRKPLKELQSKQIVNKGMQEHIDSLLIENKRLHDGYTELHLVLDTTGTDSGGSVKERLQWLAADYLAKTDRVAQLEQSQAAQNEINLMCARAHNYLGEFELGATLDARVQMLVELNKELMADNNQMHQQIAHGMPTEEPQAIKVDRYISVYSGTLDIRAIDDELQPLIDSTDEATAEDGKAREVFALVKVGEVQQVKTTKWVAA